MFFIRTFAFLFCFFIFTCVGYSQEAAPLIKTLLPDFTESSDVDTVNVDPSTLVIELTVLGNNIVSEDLILEKSGLSIGSSVNPVLISRSSKRVKSLGFFGDVEIESVQTDQGQRIIISVKEYPIVSEIIFKGNTVYNDEYLHHVIHSQTGQPYNLNSIRDDIQAIESVYEKDGYFEIKVFNVDRPQVDDMPVIFHIAEGVIEDISITGNIKTKDYVILREMDLRPGDIINRDDIQSDIRKIVNLNYFDNVIPDIVPGEEPHHYHLKFNILEKETSGGFTFGGSYAPNSGFSIFSDLYWDNIMGTGKMIMLKGNFGLATSEYNNRNTTYQFKYHNPWAFGKRKSLTFRTWVTSGSLSTFDLYSSDFSFSDQYRRGVDVAVGIPHTYDFRSNHKVKYESVDLAETDHYYLYTYRLNLSYDKRDRMHNPRSGFYHNVSLEQAFKFRTTALEFTQADVTFRRFFPLFEKQTLALKSSFGYIRSPDIDDEDIFVAQYYYVGGTTTVRGYDDSEPFAYGNKRIIGSLEYRYIFNNSLTAYLFVDSGYATKLRNDDNDFESVAFTDLKNYKVSKGVGVTFVIPPIGPIKLDFGITETGESRLQFNLGQQF